MTDLLHAAYPWLVLAVIIVITAILFARGGFFIVPPADNLHGLNDDEARMVAEERLLDAWSFADIVQRRRNRG